MIPKCIWPRLAELSQHTVDLLHHRKRQRARLKGAEFVAGLGLNLEAGDGKRILIGLAASRTRPVPWVSARLQQFANGARMPRWIHGPLS